MKLTHTLVIIGLVFLFACSGQSKQASTKEQEPNRTDTAIKKEKKKKAIEEVPVKIDTAVALPATVKSEAVYIYDFENPVNIWVLDNKLREISGLTYDSQRNTIYTINDEQGQFFNLDMETGEIKAATRFAKKGDYEAIEYFSNTIAIARHDGDLFLYDLNSKETIRYKNQLSAKNDIEGMAYHKEQNLLLLACKGQNMTDGKSRSNKAIYAFDMNAKALKEVPFINISIDTLVDKVEKEYLSEGKTAIKKLKNRIKDFAPSGIAIHPRTKEYYIISARGSTLLILDTDKQPKQIQFLDSKTIPQPEGITFDSDSNLYVSTEGQGFSGKIFKFQNR